MNKKVLPLAIGLLAFMVYFPGFWWGAPHATAPDRVQAWGVDDETPLGPLSDVYDRIEGRPDRFDQKLGLGYPQLYSFIVVTAYTPYIGYLWLTDQFKSPGAIYPYGLTNPARALKMLTLIAHFISLLMGVGIVVAAYYAGQALWNHKNGTLAALLAMVSFPMFYYSRTGNVDVPALFFVALALAVFAYIIVKGLTLKFGIWLGISVGLALATKEPSFASFLAFPFVLLPLHWQQHKHDSKLFSWKFWKVPLLTLLVVVLTYGIGSGLFVDPQRFFAHVAFVKERVNAAHSDNIAFMETYPFTLEGNIRLAKAITGYIIDSMTLPGFLLSLIGLVWVLRREPRIALFALPILTYLLVLFWSARLAQLRYVMPAVFPLTFFAARAVTYGVESGKYFVKVPLISLTVGIFGIGLLHGGILTHQMVNDSRYDAAEWLGSRTQPGDSVEYFGPNQKLPPLKNGVTTTRAIEYFGANEPVLVNDSMVREIEMGWKQRKPKFIIIMPDHSSPKGVLHSHTCPPQIYQELLNGKLGYRKAAHFETQPPISWIECPELDYPTVNPPIHIFERKVEISNQQ